MPKHSDLQILKETIQNIGDEVKIKEENNEIINDTLIPEETSTTNVENDILGNTDELMSDIMNDFQKGMVMNDENPSDINITDLVTEITPEIEKKETAQSQESIEEVSDLTSDLNEVPLFDNNEQASSDDSLNLNDLAIKNLDETSQQDDFSEIDQSNMELESLIGDLIPDDTSKSSSKDEASAALEELADLTSLEDEINQGEQSTNIDNIEPTDKQDETKEVDEILDELGKEAESYSDLQELDSLLGEEDSQKQDQKEAAPLDLDSILEPSSTEEFPNVDEPPLDSLGEAPVEEDIEKASSLDALQDLSALESADLSKNSPSAEPLDTENIEDFNLESFDTFTPEGMKDIPSEEPSFDTNVSIDTEDVAKSLEPIPLTEVPEELSNEDIKENEDITINLSDNDRKQIILSLTSLPKEAEVKIANAIISGKYSNKQLKPLIDTLLKKESPQIIIKYYEKITGDISLSKIEGVKYTGVKFEEMQKSFAYIFQKNILPILSMIASTAVVVLALIFITIRLLLPTWEATKYYEKGKKNIENKIFWEVEDNFTHAFNIQQRFGEVVEYARLYRKYKRYLEAEKKYELAVNMKSDKQDIALEYADFFREIKDFERAERKYKNLIFTDELNINALLGLAKTYYDWSEEQADKIKNAKETYLDVFEIDKKNKDAVYGQLNIYLKEKNHKEIIKHYNFINKHLSKKADPYIYAELAKYFIDIGELIEVKNVLEKASNAVSRNDYLPEINYQYARYKKLLNIFTDERSHLLNALSLLEKMKFERPDLYENEKYQKLFSIVYNDLGENYDRSSRANLKAENYFLKAIQSDPYYGKPYYNLANFSLNYKTDGYKEAKLNYLEAEQKGFSNDTLNYNLGWLYYKDKDYYNSFKRINKLFEKHPNNSNLKFMTGTIFYQMGQYDLSESMLLETNNYFQDILQKRNVNPELEEHREILEMIKRISNNLGATYQKKYEVTRKSSYIINATKYYSDSINIFETLATTKPLEAFTSDSIVFGSNSNNKEKRINTLDKYRKENAHINLRMVLYPDAGMDDPIIYEDFSLNFLKSYK